MKVRKVLLGDAAQIAKIYNYYILSSVATFEEQAISTKEMEHRIGKVTTELPWLVYENADHILGYAYATQWKPRSAYRNTVESTVYVKPESIKKGVGQQLYFDLIAKLKELNLHAVLAGITLPNEASIRLHEKLGFEKVGQLKEVGYKFGSWVDVGYWQLTMDND